MCYFCFWQPARVGASFLDTQEEVTALFKDFSSPLLALHGELDLLVLPDGTKQLFAEVNFD
jgi:hypothetical protein